MLKYTSNGCMLMEVDWGGNLKLIHTSCGCVLMEVDWGDKLILNSMVDWGTHETHCNGHNISEVDWGGHGSSSNHMTECLLSEIMTQVSSYLWGELQQTMSSTTLIGHMTDPLDTGQIEDDALNPKPIVPELDDPERLTGEPIHHIDSYLIQSNHYLSEMLSKHRDLIRIPQ